VILPPLVFPGYTHGKQINDIIQGEAQLGKNDVTREQENSTSMPPNPKVNKAEDLTYPSINIGVKPPYPLFTRNSQNQSNCTKSDQEIGKSYLSV